ncbi:Uncharacterised protein [Chlamydia trachomatis]|nr:Uncharacterised protein [Chlamydia trachomatis]
MNIIFRQPVAPSIEALSNTASGIFLTADNKKTKAYPDDNHI